MSKIYFAKSKKKHKGKQILYCNIKKELIRVTGFFLVLN